MQLGAIFPQTEIGSDPAAVKDFAQAAEDLGYEHLLVFDHVLGADASKREHWERPYSHTDTFHEPFVLFGYLAAITEKIEMTTGILILPPASDRPGGQASRRRGRAYWRTPAPGHRHRLERC